jgi:hypothetical protein
MENQLSVVLPAEVEQIAQNVSVEKRNEVQTVLNHVFNGVAKMREQLESISVKDQNDEVSMKLAGTVRLAVKRERLDAEKKFDAKRAEVQQEMLGFKTLDSLYLKAKQIMQIQTKELEEIALFKEETKKRFEAEQKELKVQQRMLKVAKVAPEMLRSEIESMSDETFEMFFSGIEKSYNDKIEAEKKAEIARIEKEKAEAEERERIKKENEQLKKEAEERERLAKAEAEKRAKEERERLAKAEVERKEREEKERKEREIYEANLKAEREAKEKIQRELEAKAEVERKEREAEKTRLEAELNKGDAEKVKDLVSDLVALKTKYSFKSAKNQKMYADVSLLIDKVINHIEK